MNNKDLSTMIDDTKLNIRVGAIIQYQNKILIEKNKNVDFSVIPGGRIKTLENSKEALIREIKEELGIDKVDLKQDYGIKDGIINLDNQDSNYYLLSQEQFQQANILPNILKEIILTKEFKHYIVNDLNQN